MMYTDDYCVSLNIEVGLIYNLQENFNLQSESSANNYNNT